MRLRRRPGDLGGLELVTQIARWMGQALEVAPLGPDDDFFEAGGDSLAAEEVFAELESRTGVILPTTVLLAASTPRAVAAAAQREHDQGPGSPVVCLRRGGAQAPLFVLPGLRGEVLWARRLADALPRGRPVYGVNTPLLLDRPLRPHDLEAMARRTLAAMREVQAVGPYHLYGPCFGGVLALEVAHQLQQAGDEMGLLAVGDTAPPQPAQPTVPSIGFRVARHRENLAGMQRALVLRYVVRLVRLRGQRTLWALVGKPLLPLTARSARLRRWYVPRLHMRAARNHYARGATTYDGDVLLFHATREQRPFGRGERLLPERWRRVEVACDHEELFLSPYVEVIAARLAEELAGVAAHRPPEASQGPHQDARADRTG